jgi:hypothetical protein
LQSPSFVWPSRDEIVVWQKALLDAEDPTDDEDKSKITYDVDKQCYVVPEGTVWVPRGCVDLQQRLCVVAHAGAGGHRRIDATLQTVSQLFYWEALKEDVTDFVKACLHCMVVDGVVEPRPWGAALHAEKPNELIHFDWLSMPTAKNGWKYILVVKDDMSGYVRLYPGEAATSQATATALTDWFGLFGVVPTWVSDCGSHFKNEVMALMRQMLGAHHHFVTPHCPWANGTVEVVNRSILRTIKVLGSEMQLRTDEWPLVLPLVQSALNMQPADRLDGTAPITAFLALPASTPLSALFHPRLQRDVTVDWLKGQQLRHVNELSASLEQLHRDWAETAEGKRARKRAARELKNGVKWANFSLGDFVLVANVAKYPNKLAVLWRGPYRVVRVVSDFLMEVQQLVQPYDITLHHACRLRVYAEADRELAEDLLDYVTHGDGGFHVEALLDLRESDGRFEALVKWLGLEEAEASWEPVAALYEDIPVVMRRWAKSNMHISGMDAMIEDLEATIGHSL